MKLFKRISYRTFLIIFFLFFIYEYGSPILSLINLAKQNDISLPEMFAKSQAFKHLIRFPLYLVGFAFLFWFVYQKNKLAYQILQTILLLHLIFKPLFIVVATLVISSNPSLQEYVSLNLPITIAWAICVLAVYLFSFFYMKTYWAAHSRLKKG